MFDTSKDILNLVLALSVAVFTGFLCWLLYVVTMSIKRIYSVIDDVHDLVESIKEKIDRAEKLFHSAEEKLKSFSSLMPIIASGIGKIIEFLQKRKSTRKRSTNRTTT